MRLSALLFFVLMPTLVFGQAEFNSGEMPEQRSTVVDEINKESSSFVPEPDSIDPLPLIKESLKDDEEPVLEDIQQALKREKVKALKAEARKNKPQLKIKKKTKVKIKKASQAEPSATTEVTDFGDRNPDEPDYSLENQFNNLYKRFNAEPTSDSTWSAARENVANVYVVQNRDTLFSVSKILFGDGQFWPKIWAINNQGIANPHIIAPGLNVNFYAGTSAKAPTISMGTSTSPSAQDSMPLTQLKEGQVDEFGDPVRDYSKQNTEFDRLVKEGSGRGQIGILPSLPELRGGKFFYKTETSIQVAPKVFAPEFEPHNPYILTSTEIATDYSVKAEDADDLVCKSGQYIPATMQLNISALPGEYNLVIKEIEKIPQLKKTHIYQNVGRVTIQTDGSLRIKRCLLNVNTDVLIVSDEKLAAVEPTIETVKNMEMQIIDGLLLQNQQYYYSKHYVIISAAEANFEEGQSFKIYSKHAGKNVGQVKILKNTGTLTLGYITNSNELIRTGDTVVIQ